MWRDMVPKGWRGSVVFGLVLALITLVLNIILTLWATNKPRPKNVDTSSGVKTIYEGTCSTSKNSITFVHLVINIIATLLLAASNTCMQILSSPQRQEIDKAHASRKWLCVGIPNIRNLKYVSWLRRVLWSIL